MVYIDTKTVCKTMMKSYFKEFEPGKSSKKDKKVVVCKHKHFDLLLKYKFTAKELKDICHLLKLPKYGSSMNKNELFQHTINTMYLYLHTLKIQKIWRNHFIRRFNNTLGPAYKNRELSNNIDDFMTTENIKDINYYEFYSFCDKDGFVYSFNIVSIYNLIMKGINENPYNRSVFDEDMKQNVINRYKMNIVLGKKHPDAFTSTNNNNPNANNSALQMNTRQTIIDLFSVMDSLGNLTDPMWLYQLRREELSRYIYELHDIWFYRAQLTPEMRRQICGRDGNPFRVLGNTNMSVNYIDSRFSLRQLQRIACSILNSFVNGSSVNSDRSLGALYVLSALTLVSESAREAMPWLYVSVQY